MTTFKLTVTAAMLCGVAAGVWGDETPPATTPPRVPVPSADPAPADGRVADARQRLRSRNNLRQILLGFHVYHDTRGHFPHDIYRQDLFKDGKPMLSWRVAILPYIGEEKLYKEFKLDEPWDSEHNRTLLARMPDVYRVGFEPKDAVKTYYQGFAGPGTVLEPWREVFEKDGKSVTFPAVKKVSLFQITDGTANTLAVVEAGPPVEWTRPADIPYDPKKPLPKIDGLFANLLMAGTADGDAHPLRPDLDETTLRRLIVRNDGQPIPPAALRPPLLPVTKEDEEFGAMLLRKNDVLIGEIGIQLAEHRKLLAELAKRRSPANPAAGVDINRVVERNKELERDLMECRRKTELLRKEVEGTRPK
jgi:hypothetical protein